MDIATQLHQRRHSRPFERILVPVAPTPAGDRALTVALQLVDRTGVPLLLLSVARPITDEVAARLAAFRSGARRTDIEARVVGYGSIARAITAAAEPGTLVCMSSHGAYGPARTLTGSVTEEVLRSAEEPVLVVGPRVPPDVSLGDGRVVACLDRSPRSAQTLAPAQQWSQAFGLPLWLVQVSPPDNPDVERTRPGDVPAERRIDRLARSLAGVDGWRVLHDRRPVRALAALAQTTPVAVLVMATRGHKGWTRVLAGSVTTSTVRRAGVPVLAVPARAAVEA